MKHTRSAGRLGTANMLAWRRGSFIASSGALLSWLVVRACAQVGLVLLLARLLGASDYGAFVAATAVGAMLGQIASLGLPGAVVRLGSASGFALAGIFRPAVRANALGILATVLLVAPLSFITLAHNVSPVALLLLIPIEITSTSAVELLARSMQADHSSHRFGMLQSGIVLLRLLGIAGLNALGHASLSGICMVYAALTLIYLVTVGVYVQRRIGPADKNSKASMRALLTAGLPFWAGGLAGRVQAEYNKPLLAHIDTARAGELNIAQRIVDVTSLPLLAAQDALWPRLYQSREPSRGVLRAAVLTFPAAMMASLGIAAGSHLLPSILGSGYEAVGSTLMLMAGLPPLSLIRNLIMFPVLAGPKPSCSLAVHAGACLASVGASTFLVPYAGMRGAVAANYIGEISAILISTAMLILVRKKRQA